MFYFVLLLFDYAFYSFCLWFYFNFNLLKLFKEYSAFVVVCFVLSSAMTNYYFVVLFVLFLLLALLICSAPLLFCLV